MENNNKKETKTNIFRKHFLHVLCIQFNKQNNEKNRILFVNIIDKLQSKMKAQ